MEFFYSKSSLILINFYSKNLILLGINCVASLKLKSRNNPNPVWTKIELLFYLI